MILQESSLKWKVRVLQFNSGLSGLIFMSVILATFSSFDIPMLEVKMPQKRVGTTWF